MNDAQTAATGTVELVVQSRVTNYREVLGCLLVAKIIDRTPSSILPRKKLNIPGNIPLADPRFHIPHAVDLLINAGTSVSLLSIGQLKLSSEHYEIRLQKTLLGWVVTGGMDTNAEGAAVCHLSNSRVFGKWKSARALRLEGTKTINAKITTSKQFDERLGVDTRSGCHSKVTT